MSELVITAANFNLQPVANLRDGPAMLRWAYNRNFLDSDNNQIFTGTVNSGFGVEVPCSIADGLISVDGDSTLWTTDDAQDPAPLSIWISAWLLTPRGVLIAQLTIAGKAQFVVPSSLAPTTTWSLFSNYNQAVTLAYLNPNYYTAPQIDRLVRQWMDDNPASDVQLGTVLLTIPADIPASPVVWGANDPLVRDADKIEGIPISTTPPLDGQVLAYNEANNQYEPSNQAAGSGNVVSNEVSSVDGQIFVASGTSGKTIKLIPDAGITDAGVMSGITVDDPADDLDIANKEFVLAAVAAAVQQTPNITALVSGGGVFWLEDYEFQVAAAAYLIQGDLFTSLGDTVTLDAADPTLDRIDVIALDENGAVVVITGTAASQPSQPDVDPGTQLLLTFVLVTANTTAPVGVSNTDIYIDNAEWTATTSGSGWNVNSTTNPHSGTKCIEGTSVANAAYVQLQAPAPLTLDTYAILSTFIASKAAWPKKRSLVFQWYTAGVAVGVPVTVNTGFFGFDSANTAYQLLAIPIAQFAVPAATSLNQLRITDQGGAIGMFIDDVVLQANGSSIGQPPTQGLTQAQADARYLQQVNNLSDVASASTARTNLGAQAGPLTGDVTTSGAAATLASTAVTPGSYTNTNLTVDAKGRLTAASNGAAGPGSSIPSTVQGDTLFASAVDTLAALAKDTNATRYLSNTGASNNPAWAQVALATGISGLGTGAATALGINVGSAGALIANGGVLGTPSSGTLTSCTGLPIGSGVSGLGSGVATFLGTPSSANLAAALTDETGSGLVVFDTSPVFTTDITLPNGASPTTGSVAKLAFDTDAWGASRGAIQVHDGTANTYVVAALASDTPTNGQVPTWNTGGTITWETPSGASIAPLVIEDADTVSQRNGLNNQNFSVYRNYVSSSNYVRIRVGWTGTAAEIMSETVGQTASNIVFRVGSTSTHGLNLGGTTLTPVTDVTMALGDSSHYFNEIYNNVWLTKSGGYLRFVGGSRLSGPASGILNIIDDSGNSGSGTIRFDSRTPSQITSNQNNYSVPVTAYFNRWDTDAARSVTGLTFGGGGVGDGQVVTVVNFGSNALVLSNQDTGSTSTNRFLTNTGMDLNLSPNEMGPGIYDNTTQRWRFGKYSTSDAATVITQFDKTTNTSLADVALDRALNVSASRTYEFEVIIYTSSNVAGGVQFAIAGTATATSIVYEAVVFSGAAIGAQSRATALGTAVGGVTAVTAAYVRITGTIVVNAAGTLTLQFAQNASVGTSSVLVGSVFRINKAR